MNIVYNSVGWFEDTSIRKRSGSIALLAAFVTFSIVELVGLSLLYGGTSSISVLSAATQEWLLSQESAMIILFLVPIVLTTIVGFLVLNVTSLMAIKIDEPLPLKNLSKAV